MGWWHMLRHYHQKEQGQESIYPLTFRPGRSYHTKYIDAVELGSSRKQLHFGSRIFNIRSNGDERYARRPYRIQFRYNSALSAAVRWDGKHAGIICDHLAPSKENLKEKWFSYGPDFSYDRVLGKREMADSGSLSARSKPRGSTYQWKGANYLGSKKIIAECLVIEHHWHYQHQ